MDAFCATGRPESIMGWKRNPRVQQALSAIGDGTLPITHNGIDHADLGREGEHLRAILMHLALLPARNSDLIRLEQWLERRLATIDDPGIRRPLEQFATWHHLERIRRKDRRNESVAGSTIAVRQEITAVQGFLNWLHDSKGRTIQDCAQADIDQWLAEGRSGRWAIRTFIVWTTKNHLSAHLVVGHRPITSSRLLSNDERLRLLRLCLSEEPESLAYRVAAIILLLYAQPVSRIVGFTIDQVIRSPAGECYLRLGADQAFVPDPFADLLQQHLTHRSNTQTINTTGNPFLFPSRRAGQHLTAETVMHRLRRMGIDLLGTRNRALRDLVQQVPPPVVAAQLGYNPRTALKHSALAAEPEQRYGALIRRNL